MSSLLLSAAEVRALIEPRELLDGLRAAMMAYDSSARVPARRSHSAIPSGKPQSVMIVFPGVVPGIPAYTVKINAKMPDATPSVRGVIALIDSETGALLAVMDSIAITAIRTALVGAIAVDALARRSIRTVAVIGCGVQGHEQLRALRLVRQFERVHAFDVVEARASALAQTMRAELGVMVDTRATIADTVREADVIIAATWATTPILTSKMVAPGAHITTLGADEPGKAELSADLITKAVFVCDDEALALEMGALAAVKLGPEAIHATLGAVLAGTKRGRTDDKQITVFASVGLPCQDLPAAWMVYNRAKARGDAKTFDFHSLQPRQ